MRTWVSLGVLAAALASGLLVGIQAAGAGREKVVVTHVFSIGVDGQGRRDLSGNGSVSDEGASVSRDRTTIVFLRGGEPWVMSSDGSGQRPLLAPEALEAFADESFAPPAWSPDGNRLALSAVSTASCRPGETKCASWYLVLVDLEGKRVAELGSRRNASWSPTGRRLAYEQAKDGGFSLTPEETEIAVSSADGSGARSISRGIRHAPDECLAFPVWSPDGRRVAFERAECYGVRAKALYVVPVGKGKRHELRGASHPSWSPNGSKLALLRGAGLLLARGDGTAPQKLAADAGPAVWSSDGSRLAFGSSRASKLWVLDVRTKRLRQIMQETVGSRPVALAFSRDGKRIFYAASGT